jgi:hypothetical protein
VDGKPKKEKMTAIGRLLLSQPKRRLLADAIGGARAMLM